MAARGSCAAVGIVHCIDHWEVIPLKLSAEHVPFPCSLRELVLDRYGDPPGTGGNAHPMQIDELIEYLRKIDNFSLSPWVAVVGQTEAIGDPATPSREQVAILRWLGKALEIWEKQFPLEGRLAAQVRRLKPLSAALALVDPWFMQPGVHPMHQLLDSIQARAIGWQARLDRVGAVLEQQVTRAVDDARQWFDTQSVDLTGICAEFTAAAERDQARAQRMIQRVVETETGKVKTASAKLEAARMINAALEKFPAPEEIGSFLKGPWYTSAQLLLLKFGPDSDQWHSMSATTETLLDSLQSIEDASEERRKHIFEVVTQLPKDMRRWLLSLHHDTEAVNEAMGLVEYTHLKILRKQSPDLLHIAPIMVEGDHVLTGERQSPGISKHWQEGQWYSVNAADDGAVRMQLVLKVEQSQQLLFTNLAGIKVLQLSFADFNRLIEQDRVKVLQSGASFSLCLAYAVGIDSVEILNALANALAESESDPAPDSDSVASSIPAPTLAQAPEVDESPPPATSTPAAAQPFTPIPAQPSTPTPAPTAELALESSPEQEPVPERLEATAELEAARPPAEPERANAAGPESDQDRQARGKQRPVRKKQVASGYLVEQAQEIKARGGYRNASLREDDTKDPGIQPLSANKNAIPEKIPAVPEVSSADTPSPRREQYATERQINLPMGAWLGFHDGEMPLMARLAVHDTEEDYFIFVNRKGVKMRQISRLELLDLIDQGLVDILEASSNFRNEVTEVRKNLDQ